MTDVRRRRFRWAIAVAAALVAAGGVVLLIRAKASGLPPELWIAAQLASSYKGCRSFATLLPAPGAAPFSGLHANASVDEDGTMSTLSVFPELSWKDRIQRWLSPRPYYLLHAVGTYAASDEIRRVKGVDWQKFVRRRQ